MWLMTAIIVGVGAVLVGVTVLVLMALGIEAWVRAYSRGRHVG